MITYGKPSLIGLFGILSICLDCPVKRTIISSMAQLLLDGVYADRKEFANIDAIGSSCLYHGAAAGGGAVGGGGAGGASDIWIYR